jgi:hypothetical protein
MALAAAVLMAPSGASAYAAKPALCEHGCGGSWGAFEHAKVYAEEHGGPATVSGCTNLGTNQRGVAQWECWGYWNKNHEGPWAVGIDPYGYEVWFVI